MRLSTIPQTCTYTYVYTYTHAYIHAYIHTYVHRYVYTYVYTVVYVLNTYLYIYSIICKYDMPTYVHTYMHMKTGVHTRICMLPYTASQVETALEEYLLQDPRKNFWSSSDCRLQNRVSRMKCKADGFRPWTSNRRNLFQRFDSTLSCVHVCARTRDCKCVLVKTRIQSSAVQICSS